MTIDRWSATPACKGQLHFCTLASNELSEYEREIPFITALKMKWVKWQKSLKISQNGNHKLKFKKRW